jgi:allophanate hydrolase subunit 1
MHIKKFNKRHLPLIKQWMNLHKVPLHTADDLPELGYIVFEHEQPVCAAFLRKVEGNFALIDSAISNPEISPPIRREAMDFMCDHLIRVAKHMKLKMLLVLTLDKNTIYRIKARGFSQGSDILFQLPLGTNAQE